MQQEYDVLQASLHLQFSVPPPSDPQARPSTQITSHATDSLSLKIPIEFGCERPVHIVNHGVTTALSLSSLPHLLLEILLPPTYPLRDPPRILSLRATHSWLPRLSVLRELLLDLWQPDNSQGVLYTWLEWIRSGEFLGPMQLISGGTILIPHPTPQSLSRLLSSHDLQTTQAIFSQTSHHCSLCLSYPKGSRCLQLSCRHVFCHVCLSDFWGWCIAEGDIARVMCPDPGCVKEGAEASEVDVSRVVNKEQLTRWKHFREKRILEKDPTMIHCPISSCQTPVPKPQLDSESEQLGWARLRTCQNCHFSFCSFCKRTWHGPIVSCPITSTEILVLEYMALSPEDPAKELLERRFGRNNILKLVQKYEEDRINKEWIDATTTQCPGCSVRVEKSLGCNHMTCSKCRQHFCYRCGEKLTAQDPYKHFSTPGHSCFWKLFDFEIEVQEWERFDVL